MCKENKPKEIEMETCVLCGCTTDVPVIQPIDYRENYIEGAGQTCEECYFKTYWTNLREEHYSRIYKER